jgi:hypothetical protein
LAIGWDYRNLADDIQPGIRAEGLYLRCYLKGNPAMFANQTVEFRPGLSKRITPSGLFDIIFEDYVDTSWIVVSFF